MAAILEDAGGSCLRQRAHGAMRRFPTVRCWRTRQRQTLQAPCRRVLRCTSAGPRERGVAWAPRSGATGLGWGRKSELASDIACSCWALARSPRRRHRSTRFRALAPNGADAGLFRAGPWRQFSKAPAALVCGNGRTARCGDFLQCGAGGQGCVKCQWQSKTALFWQLKTAHIEGGAVLRGAAGRSLVGRPLAGPAVRPVGAALLSVG